MCASGRTVCVRGEEVCTEGLLEFVEKIGVEEYVRRSCSMSLN